MNHTERGRRPACKRLDRRDPLYRYHTRIVSAVAAIVKYRWVTVASFGGGPRTVDTARKECTPLGAFFAHAYELGLKRGSPLTESDTPAIVAARGLGLRVDAVTVAAAESFDAGVRRLPSSDPHGLMYQLGVWAADYLPLDWRNFDPPQHVALYGPTGAAPRYRGHFATNEGGYGAGPDPDPAVSGGCFRRVP